MLVVFNVFGCIFIRNQVDETLIEDAIEVTIFEGLIEDIGEILANYILYFRKNSNNTMSFLIVVLHMFLLENASNM